MDFIPFQRVLAARPYYSASLRKIIPASGTPGSCFQKRQLQMER